MQYTKSKRYMSEWKEYKLGDLTIDGKGCYGIAAPAVEYDVNKYTYLRITDINDDGTINKNGLKSVDNKNASNYLLKPNDIVFARTGASVGRSYFYDVRDGELVYAGFLIKYSLDPTKVNPKLLKFYTHSQPYYDWIQTVDNGATRGNINAQTYASMPVMLPDRNKQDEIVSILSSLDDKIDLLNRENTTFEAMAETLFRQWFIEEAKEEWEEGKLGDICEYVKEKADITNIDKNTYVTTENMRSNKQGVVPPSSVPENIKVTIYSPDDILLSNIRPYFKKLWLSDRNGGCSNDVLCIRSKNEVFKHLVYYTIRQDDFFDYVMLGSKGSKMPRGDKQHIMNWPIQMPPYPHIKRFNDLVADCIEKMQSNNRQVQCLQAQRDILLPKLMSNEIAI